MRLPSIERDHLIAQAGWLATLALLLAFGGLGGCTSFGLEAHRPAPGDARERPPRVSPGEIEEARRWRDVEKLTLEISDEQADSFRSCLNDQALRGLSPCLCYEAYRRGQAFKEDPDYVARCTLPSAAPEPPPSPVPRAERPCVDCADGDPRAPVPGMGAAGVEPPSPGFAPALEIVNDLAACAGKDPAWRDLCIEEVVARAVAEAQL